MGQIAAALERGSHLVGLCLAPVTMRLGITQGEAHVLARVAAHGPSPVAALHREFGHRRSTLTNILNRLEERGLALRELNPRDRRSLVVHLTPAGRRAARTVAEALDGLESTVRAHVAERDVDGLEAVVAALAVTAKTGASRRA